MNMDGELRDRRARGVRQEKCRIMTRLRNLRSKIRRWEWLRDRGEPRRNTELGVI